MAYIPYHNYYTFIIFKNNNGILSAGDNITLLAPSNPIDSIIKVSPELTKFYLRFWDNSHPNTTNTLYDVDFDS
jgi:hypothetical protein